MSWRRTKEFVNQYGASTAIVLRLSSDYFGSSRTVIGDSAFSSLKTRHALLQRGLHYIGIIVKTTNKEFPKQYLENWGNLANTRRGDHITLKTKVIVHNTQKQVYTYMRLER